MNKIVGYILGIAGIAVFALSYPAVRTMIGITTFPINVPDIYLTIFGVVLLLAGAFLAFKSSSSQEKEVPIYEGHGKKRKIVGYQREQ